MVGLNRWLGISFSGCGLLLVSVSVMGNFFWFELVIRHKFQWLWVVLVGILVVNIFWLG